MGNSERVRDYTKRPITTAIFDVGGVLINQHPKAQNEAVIETICLETPKDRERYYALWHGQKLSSQYHRGRITNPKAALEFYDLTGINLLADRQPDDSPLVKVSKSMTAKSEVLTIVAQLSGIGVTPVVLSNSMQAGDVLRDLGIYDHFHEEHLVFSHKIGMLKPDREIYEHTLERAAVDDPADAVFWDDVDKNVAGANEVGIHGRLFKDEETILADLRELGVVL
ncbi:MAG: HAD-IA family hydrolase [Candidatus Levybacteria bacterium]|nr:HAD-IA family hydrolase [Candidatus Levybacteria bacterium]